MIMTVGTMIGTTFRFKRSTHSGNDAAEVTGQLGEYGIGLNVDRIVRQHGRSVSIR